MKHKKNRCNGAFFRPDSAVWFLFGVCVPLAISVSSHPIFLGLALLAVFVALFLRKINAKQIFLYGRYLFWLLALVFLLHFFAHEGKPLFRVWFLQATYKGAWWGFLFSLKLLVFAYAAYFIFSTVNFFELVCFTERIGRFLGHLSKFVSFAAICFFVAFRFISEFAEKTKKTLLAFKTKGIDFEGSLSRKAKVACILMVPLFVNAFKQMETVSSALNMKGYATRYKNAVWPPMRLSPANLICVSVSLAFLFAGWLWRS